MQSIGTCCSQWLKEAATQEIRKESAQRKFLYNKAVSCPSRVFRFTFHEMSTIEVLSILLNNVTGFPFHFIVEVEQEGGEVRILKYSYVFFNR